MTKSICYTSKLFINYRLRRIKPVSRFLDTFAPVKQSQFGIGIRLGLL